MEKIEIPGYEKKLGGEAFKKNDIEKAIKHYSKALMSFNFLVKSGEHITNQE